ncbi:putative DNA-directed RNA polymerase [Medicago truncatula]|uniref:Putative DNA-directed RNA polymerase n=1 Tax=Medicago truncatula TaxID=3880 RepID=A0A396J334_MEDTR|nr:putative DNA-directed RNA polymerase [Medicago truncatula]
MGHVGSSKDANLEMDIDLNDDEEKPSNAEILNELGEDMVKYFCKKASIVFFNEYGLISHQINSYN